MVGVQRLGRSWRRAVIAAALLAPATAMAMALAAWLAFGAGPRPEAPPALEIAAGGYEILDALEGDRPFLGVAVKAGRGGHYQLRAKVNGWPLDFLVDTGASYVTLNYNDARQAGLSLPASAFKHEVRTANGVARVAAVRLQRVEYRSLRVENVVALVTQRGAMDGMNLLGNSFLGKLQVFKVQNGHLIMR